MGPTACGKTDTAIRLYQQCPIEIVSVDSAMVYRGMDIGTAKPTKAERDAAPHHLIDICDPSEAYSVGRFVEDAKSAIEAIHQLGKTPLLVGGTMMYFYQLQQGMHALPATIPTVRAQVKALIAADGIAGVYHRLAEVDPTCASRLNKSDVQRVSRAYEIFLQTGRTLSQWRHDRIPHTCDYDFQSLILAPNDRSEIHAKIEQRFDQMLADGFIDEVEALYARGDLSADMPAIRSVGYRQAWAYLEKSLQFDEMRARAIIATRQLCKRQFTWLRRWHNTPWVQTVDAALDQLTRWVQT